MAERDACSARAATASTTGHRIHLVAGRVSHTEVVPPSEHALFLVPPERFVAARDALVRALRAQGDAREGEVRALRRPTPSAWLVNVLVRTKRREIDALLRAGDALRAAQHEVLTGAPVDALATATKDVRSALSKLVAHARAILREHGRKPTPDLIRRISTTLRSASLDPSLRPAVLEAKLLRDPVAPDEDQGVAPERWAEARAKKVVGQRHAREARLRAESARRAAEARRAEEARREAERRAAEQAARRAAVIERARARLDEERSRAEAARKAVATARRALVKAEREAERARVRLERVRAELDAAERGVA